MVRPLVKPILRLTVFVAALAALLGYLDYRAARASVVDHLMGIGRRMAPYLDDARSTEAPRQVRINGVPLLVAAGRTAHPPSFVKKWYTDRYASRGDGLDKFAAELRARGALPPGIALNQLSFGGDQQGGVAALDFGDQPSVRTLRDRLIDFVKTGNLGEVGRLRYVWYEKTADGGTRFLTVWTDERFNLTHLMPLERRDADGKDIDGVPRYPGTVRVLSAEERGMPERLAVYDGPGSPEAAQLFYQARMQTLGWSSDESFRKVSAEQGHTALRFENAGGHEVLVDLSESERHQGLTVVVIQTR
jgi:hypothetical protein